MPGNETKQSKYVSIEGEADAWKNAKFYQYVGWMPATMQDSFVWLVDARFMGGECQT